jgi:glycosyltransferase involved in cell wall biosynthesis
MRQHRTDVVITVGTGGDRMFWGRLAAWLARVPVIISAVHSMPSLHRLEWPNRLLARITDAFVAVSPRHRQELIEEDHYPAARLHVIPNGVDTDRFRVRPAERSIRDALHLPAVAPVVGCVAIFRPEKNHARLLRVARRVLSEIPQVHFVVVGDGAERANIESMAAQTGLSERCRFTGRRSDVADLLTLFDVKLLTSNIETSPVSILEAMASGKPVVATRVGSVPDIVSEGVTGFLANPEDEEMLAARTSHLLRDRDLALRMGRAGRERVLRDHTTEHMVEGYERLITEMYERKHCRKKAPATGSRLRWTG